ncbi:hypothetical protein CO676_20550 [Sinorhizobium sp. BJ1]|nr:hypothetical protein CO676_20550 [Sinorhizobium sp. BJ1]
MVYDWEGRRTRRLQLLRFIGALAVPALLLGSAMTAAKWAKTGTSTIAARSPAVPR